MEVQFFKRSNFLRSESMKIYWANTTCPAPGQAFERQTHRRGGPCPWVSGFFGHLMRAIGWLPPRWNAHKNLHKTWDVIYLNIKSKWKISFQRFSLSFFQAKKINTNFLKIILKKNPNCATRAAWTTTGIGCRGAPGAGSRRGGRVAPRARTAHAGILPDTHQPSDHGRAD